MTVPEVVHSCGLSGRDDMRFLFRLIASLIVGCSFAVVAMAQDHCVAGDDPDVFYEECFQKIVPIPREVIEAVLRTETGKQGLAGLDEGQRREVGKLFRAREMNLGPRNEEDLVIIGEGRMSGVDNTWFWIVRLLPDHPLVVLWAGANSVDLLKSRTNGLRDVKSDWCSAAVCIAKTFHFEHGSYKCVRTKSKSNS